MIAAQLETELRQELTKTRQLSRVAGAARLRAEAASIGIAELPAVGRIEAVAHDMRRAQIVANSYAERWLRVASASAETKVAAAAKHANRHTYGSLHRIGVTENAEAFNAERTRVVRYLDARGSLLRVWDAQNDKRTCPTCWGSEGTIVGLRENFPNGEPGAVHPHCRCSWTLITATFE